MRLGPLAAILLAPPNYRRPVPVISGAHSLSKTPEPFLWPASGRWVSSKVESCTPRLGDACLPARRQASIPRSFGLSCPLGYGTVLDFRVGSGPEVGDRGRAIIARRIARRRLGGLRQRLPGGILVLRWTVRD